MKDFALDDDNDGITDSLDKCSSTPLAVGVDNHGCSEDQMLPSVLNVDLYPVTPGVAPGETLLVGDPLLITHGYSAHVDEDLYDLICFVLREGDFTQLVIPTETCMDKLTVKKEFLLPYNILTDEIPFPALQYGKTYWWSVKAKNSYTGNESKITKWLGFRTIGDADYDGVLDGSDLCPNTPIGQSADANGCAESDFKVTPTPTILSAEFEPGNCRNHIAWDDVGAAQYKMYWGTSPDVTTGSQLATPTPTTDYGHTGVVPGWTYYYRIMAVFADGSESALSAVASASVPADAAQNCGNVTPNPLPDTGQTQKYTTTFGEDADYTINPPSYTNNGDGTVTDNVTGLMWQKARVSQTYNWYRAAGVYDGSYNRTTQNVCQEQTTGNHHDWRLPTKKELAGIVDYSRYYPNPSINPVFTGYASFYWSSTAYAASSSTAWVVYFDSGFVSIGSKSQDYIYVRCVRGGQ